MAKSRDAGMPFILILVFIDMLGLGLVMPVLPVLVGDFVEARDMQSYWFGALSISYGVTQFACAPLLGALSDRFGRRPLLLASICGMGLHYLIIAIAPNLWVMLLARVAGGITGASFSVANAYASDVTTPQDRAKAFGKLGAVFGLGFICGPLLGGVLGDIDLKLPYYVAAAFSLLNAVYGVFVLPESLPADRRAPITRGKLDPFSALGRLLRRRDIGSLMLVYGAWMLAHMILVETWVLYTHFRFDWGPRENGMSLFAVGIMAALVQGGMVGRLVARFGEQRLAVMGLASGVCAYLGYGLASEGWMMYVIIGLSVLTFATGPALRGMVSKASDPSEQGVTMGSLSSLSSLMTIVAPLLGVPLLAQVSDLDRGDYRIGVTFYLCAALELLALVLARRLFFTRPSAASEASVATGE